MGERIKVNLKYAGALNFVERRTDTCKGAC